MVVNYCLPLSRGKWTLVDSTCPEEILKRKWSYANNGYAVCNWKGRNSMVTLHRKVMDAQKGDIIDHINGDKLDNRLENLRFITVKGNGLNRNELLRDNVYYCDWAGNKPWRVLVARKHCGYYHTKEEALAVAEKEKNRLIKGEQASADKK